MKTPTLQIKQLDENAKCPIRAHANDAGVDLFAIHDVVLPPNEPIKIKTGVAMALPAGHVGLICDRSSMGAKGIRVLGGVVDEGYRGEVQVLLINLRNQAIQMSKHDKIAQMLILPVSYCAVEAVSELDDTHRGEDGFGSTGQR